jgi:hypothetical protein
MVYVVGRTRLGVTQLFGVFTCNDRAEDAEALLGPGGFVSGLQMDTTALLQRESREELEEALIVVDAARQLGILDGGAA